MRVSTTLALIVTVLASVHAWTNQQLSRKDMLKNVGGAAAGWLLATSAPPAFAESLPSGVTYEVIKSGDGPKPDVGELAAIRFAAFAGENKIDDIFVSPEPYYTRMGSGGLIPGVESTLPLMRVGDRWKLTIPVRESSAL
jgi:FKBP-type peptidyl-prolyl cis-trans isomerase